MSAPFIAASTRAAAGSSEFSTDVIAKSEGMFLHLKSIDEFAPKNLLEVIRKPLEVRHLFSQLCGEQSLWIWKRGESPIDGDLIAVQLNSKYLDPTAIR